MMHRVPAVPAVLAALGAPAALLLALPASLAAQLGKDFDSASYVSDADHGEFRARGDFNNDGHEDLVHTTNWLDWSGVTIFLGDGTGKFTPQAEHPFDTASGYDFAETAPAVGDFDGDGNLDFATERRKIVVGGDLLVLFGDGAGGFSGQALVPFGQSVITLYAGESGDGDAADELLVKYSDASFQRGMAWVNWNGSGFSQSPTLPLGGAADPNDLFVESLGDVDGDGDDDVVGTSTSPHALVRLFPTVGGVPTYGSTFPVPAAMQNVNHRIKAADADGDGDVDLIHLKMDTSDVGPWVQTYENVAGSLVQRPAQSVPTPATGWFQPHNLRLGDWNGDGWLDLFSQNIQVDIVRSNGDWTFSEGVELSAMTQSPGAGAFDVDGDGHTDYVGGRTIQWGDGTFDAPVPATSVGGGTFPDEYVPLDLDGDGDVDLAGGPTGARSVNDGSGAFTYESGTGSLFSTFFPAPPAAGFSYGHAVAFADFTGDGRPDYLVQMLFNFGGFPSFVEMRMLAGDATGHFVDVGVAAPALVQIAKAGAAPDEHWETADADGDGDLDLLENGGWWRNNGSGYLEAFVATANGRLFDANDVDGDGDVDLLARTVLGGTGELALLRNDGTGAYAPEVLGMLSGDPLARFVDLDEDGDADVAAADPDGKQLLVAQNQGASFDAAVTIEARVPNLRMLGVADANGDGVTDLLTLRLMDQGVPFGFLLATQYVRTGPGLDYAIAEECLPTSVLGGGFSGFLDVDFDGDLDLAGKNVRKNGSVTPSESGLVQQFGAGIPGTGDVVPLLGAKGPPTSTHSGSEIRLVRAVGGGMMWFTFGLNEVAAADLPLPGMTLYVAGGALLGPFPLGGAPGQAGAGSFELPLPKIPALAGLVVVHQMFVLDAASPSGGTSTNGLRLTYGL